MIKVEKAAGDKKSGLTLGELREFLAETLHSDLPDDTCLKGTVGFGGQLQKVETRS